MNLRAVRRLRCPRCLEGAVFRSTFRTHETCPVCGLRFEREPGYWVGAMYFSYAGAVALGAAVAVACWVAGASIGGTCAAVTVAVAVAAPWIYRRSRVLWLHFDQRWDPR